MPASLQRESDNIYRLDVSGILSKTELDGAQDALTADIGRIPGTERSGCSSVSTSSTAGTA